MFGLEGSGFIISLGVTLLLCGVVAYYAKNQFSLMEHKITSMFDLVSSLAGQVNHLNKMIVGSKVNDVQPEQQTTSNKSENGLILVSESEYSENESDDSDESDTDSETSDIHISNQDVTLNESQNLTMGSELDNIKVVELDIDNDNDNDNNNDNLNSQDLLQEPESIELESGNNSLAIQHSDSSSSESETDDESQLSIKTSEIETINLQPVEVLKIDDDDNNNNIKQNLDYKKLQVKVLRELVKERGLSENPSKINKKDLVKLLEA